MSDQWTVEVSPVVELICHCSVCRPYQGPSHYFQQDQQQQHQHGHQQIPWRSAWDTYQ